MPSEVRWYQEPEIIYHKLAGKYSPTELREAVQREITLAAKSSRGTVHVLRDMREMEAVVPPDITLSVRIAQVIQKSKIDQIVIVGPNRLMRYMMEITLRMAPIHIKIFDTMEEGEAFLRGILERDRVMGRGGDVEAE